MADPFDPPPELSPYAQEIWRSVVPGKRRSPGALAMIRQALKCLDRAEQAGVELTKSGLTVKTESTGAVHISPLAKVERENRALFATMWAKLSLEWDATIDGRAYEQAARQLNVVNGGKS